MNATAIEQHRPVPVTAIYYIMLCCSLLLNFLTLQTARAWGSNERDDQAEQRDTTLSPAPGSYRMLSDSGYVRFPFDLFRGDIRFRGAINGHEVHLLLDDGFMWDPILFWGSPRVDSLGLAYDGEVTIGEEDEANALQSRTASGITVRFPGIEFTEQTAVVTPYSSGTSTMWFGSVGQVSCTFLKHLVVEINFDEMLITLTEPEKFAYHGRGVEIPWQPLGFGPWAIPATLELADGRRVSMDLMMDLGYNTQLQIATKSKHDFTAPEQTLPKSLGFNIQGEETRGFIGRVPRVEIGGYTIKDVLAGFVAEEHTGHTYHEVMIGLGLLSRFNLVFDYTRQRMFVEPNESFDRQFEYDMSGLSMRKGRNSYFTITQVHAESPAGEAGLQVGDKVIRINGQPAADYSFWDLQPLLRQSGTTLTLLVECAGLRREVSFVLRRLI